MKKHLLVGPVTAFLMLTCCSLNAVAMQIYISATPGLEVIEPTWDLSSFPLTMEVESNDTVDVVEALINQMIPTITLSHEVLFFGLQELEGDQTLAFYNIQKESTLSLNSTLSLRVPVPATILLISVGLVRLASRRGSNNGSVCQLASDPRVNQ